MQVAACAGLGREGPCQLRRDSLIAWKRGRGQLEALGGAPLGEEVGDRAARIL